MVVGVHGAHSDVALLVPVSVAPLATDLPGIFLSMRPERRLLLLFFRAMDDMVVAVRVAAGW